MSKSIFEKNDLKGITLFSLHALIESQNEQDDAEKKNKLIIVTSFGFIEADRLLPNKFEKEAVTSDNIATSTLQMLVSSRNKQLEEKGNEEVFNNQTSFILENVRIIPFSGGNPTNLPTMILFSDQVVGLTFGDIDLEFSPEYEL